MMNIEDWTPEFVFAVKLSPRSELNVGQFLLSVIVLDNANAIDNSKEPKAWTKVVISVLSKVAAAPDMGWDTFMGVLLLSANSILLKPERARVMTKINR